MERTIRVFAKRGEVFEFHLNRECSKPVSCICYSYDNEGMLYDTAVFTGEDANDLYQAQLENAKK